ncbi:MAG: carbohydrate-binding family 9-like protein [Planctomycetota bacterium]|nr:carbohydrate-binding family 9-like protein [Planctomycetota bacterium]
MPPEFPDPSCSADEEMDIHAAETASPRQAICYRTNTPLCIDGKATEPIWAHALWSEDFIDIEGPLKPPPRFRTRMKMLHDDVNLYVHAELEEPHVWGTITKRNEVIFHDNDFELFIDPDGDNHNYYELEVNALGTIWELSLPKPYRCGGEPRDPDPLEGVQVGVHVDGTLNAPGSEDRGWCVTIAIPFAGLSRFAGKDQACPPRDGDQWRMNFSRVQWPHEIVDGAYRKIEGAKADNWVWSRQGVIDMHRPSTWGCLQFSDLIAGQGEAKVDPDSTRAARNVLMGIWERQQRRHEPSADLEALGLGDLTAPITITRQGDAWRATMLCEGPSGRVEVSVDHAAHFTIRPR